LRKALALLQKGAKCPEVSYAKWMINLASSRRSYGFRWETPFNAEDQTFTQALHKAVLLFQKAAGFTGKDVDGIIGNQTWGALGVQLAITYPIQMVPQPKPHTCFECSGKMVQNGKAVTLGKTKRVGVETSSGKLVEVGADGKRRPIDRNADPDVLKLFAKGGLWMGEDAGSLDEHNLKLFARRNGWQSYWPPVEFEKLAEWMASAPVLAGGFLVQPGQTDYPGHAVVIGAIWTDWTEEGTLIKIFDPFPVGKGRIYATRPSNLVIAGRQFRPEIFYVPAQAHQKSMGAYQIWEDNIPKY
jgi:hypothetical protein